MFFFGGSFVIEGLKLMFKSCMGSILVIVFLWEGIVGVFNFGVLKLYVKVRGVIEFWVICVLDFYICIKCVILWVNFVNIR